MRRLLLSLVSGLPLLGCLPATASAQFSLPKVDDIYIYGQVGQSLGIGQSDKDWLHGFGVEISFDYGDVFDGVNGEVALGYSEVSGYDSALGSIESRGALRTLPLVSAYLTFDNCLPGPLKLFLGLSSGIVKLQSFRAYQPAVDDMGNPIDGASKPYTLSAESVPIGASVGLVLPWNFSIDIGYQRWAFSSLEVSDDTVPDVFPRKLDLSSWLVTLAFRMPMNHSDKEKKTEALAADAKALRDRGERLRGWIAEDSQPGAAKLSTRFDQLWKQCMQLYRPQTFGEFIHLCDEIVDDTRKEYVGLGASPKPAGASTQH